MESLYRHYDSNDNLLYIGVSLNALNRLSQHKRTGAWFNDISRVSIDKYETRQLVLDAEREAIVNESPKYNKQHSNNKDNLIYNNELVAKLRLDLVLLSTEKLNSEIALVNKMLEYQSEINELQDWKLYRLQKEHGLV